MTIPYLRATAASMLCKSCWDENKTWLADLSLFYVIHENGSLACKIYNLCTQDEMNVLLCRNLWLGIQKMSWLDTEGTFIECQIKIKLPQDKFSYRAGGDLNQLFNVVHRNPTFHLQKELWNTTQHIDGNSQCTFLLNNPSMWLPYLCHNYPALSVNERERKMHAFSCSLFPSQVQFCRSTCSEDAHNFFFPLICTVYGVKAEQFLVDLALCY